MSNKYHSWCLCFTDTRERSTSDKDADGKIEVEAALSSIFYNMNREGGDENGHIDTRKIWLLRESANFNYITYLKVAGENAKGYGAQMFN